MTPEDGRPFRTEIETGRLAPDSPLPRAAAALMAHAAFVDPGSTFPVFDALAAAVLDGSPDQARDTLLEGLPWTATGSAAARPVPEALWDGFWALVARPPAGPVDPLAFTTSVVALGALYDAELLARCEAALGGVPSVAQLLATPEVRLRNADLDGLPAGSLGAELARMLAAQGYDLEVIDADTVVLDGPWPAQNRTNRRILQLHDIWHLVAGYGFTPAGEIAISGFQLAQFGQNYAARFLAVVAALAAVHMTPLAFPLLTLMLEGWRHGRTTPPLLALPWHTLLARPIAELRADLGVRLFTSRVAGLFDATPAAAPQAA
ncbi:MAG: Coq4 family protein [Sphingomonadaceae bacterium]|uniref:Coq4 family protein n=1 Tax=Thermaurantiacus sp. TaxID=2820283 RepID=UPI00298F19D5|nr:Coq4 family protein [Thermaurantiacus sp.]MCS6987589.1 Coq4 family protein [Sphingomonadaceae bacterium]MDW8415190.1 Coq4 family protein [Thermaurantiacus sp.]